MKINRDDRGIKPNTRTHTNPYKSAIAVYFFANLYHDHELNFAPKYMHSKISSDSSSGARQRQNNDNNNNNSNNKDKICVVC